MPVMLNVLQNTTVHDSFSVPLAYAKRNRKTKDTIGPLKDEAGNILSESKHMCVFHYGRGSGSNTRSLVTRPVL